LSSVFVKNASLSQQIYLFYAPYSHYLNIKVAKQKGVLLRQNGVHHLFLENRLRHF